MASTAELERNSARSLYEQIVDRLRQHVVDARGDAQLPTEDDLTRLYHVSRSTVRKAIEQLVDEGLLVRRRGKGTFISRPLPSIVHPIDRVPAFYDTFRQIGEDFHTEVTAFYWDNSGTGSAALADWERPLLNIKRRYVSRGVPHAMTHIALPASIGRRITYDDISSTPIYEVLRGKLGLSLQRAEFLVSCRQPSVEIAEALEISQSGFLLVLDRITRDDAGRPVESMTHFLRPDVYKLSVATDLAALLPEQAQAHSAINQGDKL
jgi:GntR family transcriptional regulator